MVKSPGIIHILKKLGRCGFGFVLGLINFENGKIDGIRTPGKSLTSDEASAALELDVVGLLGFCVLHCPPSIEGDAVTQTMMRLHHPSWRAEEGLIAIKPWRHSLVEYYVLGKTSEAGHVNKKVFCARFEFLALTQPFQIRKEDLFVP